MRHFFVAVAALTLFAHSQAAGQELRVFTVDLDGNPKNGIKVRLKEFDVEATSNKRGVARFTAKLDPDSGALRSIKGDDGLERQLGALSVSSATMEVNLKGVSATSRNRKDVIGRVKSIRWNDSQEFELGFVVPMWQKDEVASRAGAIVRSEGLVQPTRFRSVQFAPGQAVTSPRRIAVAVRFDDNAPGGASIVAKAMDAGETWIEEMASTLPSVSMPHLASELYRDMEVGASVPAHFAADIGQLRAAVEEINRNTQNCLRFPGGPPQAARPNAPQTRLSPITPSLPPIGGGGTIVGPPSPPPSVLVGKVLIRNRGSYEFDLQLNSQRIRIRGGGQTTIPVVLGTVTTQVLGQNNSTQNNSQANSAQAWNHWQLRGDEYVLYLNVCTTIRYSAQLVYNYGANTRRSYSRGDYQPIPAGVPHYTVTLTTSECPSPRTPVAPPPLGLRGLLQLGDLFGGGSGDSYSGGNGYQNNTAY